MCSPRTCCQFTTHAHLLTRHRLPKLLLHRGELRDGGRACCQRPVLVCQLLHLLAQGLQCWLRRVPGRRRASLQRCQPLGEGLQRWQTQSSTGEELVQSSNWGTSSSSR